MLKDSILVDIEENRPPGTSWATINDQTQASEAEIQQALFQLHAVELKGEASFFRASSHSYLSLVSWALVGAFSDIGM